MRIPRTRGAVSGLLLMILGAWGALVPFIGPYFDLVIGSDQTWDWSSGRLWLSVVPGVVAFVGGFLLLTSANRATAGIGAWMAIAAGAWFVVGPTVSMLWNDGESAAGAPAGGTNQQVLEILTMFYGLGALIATLGAFALGRLAVRSVKDAELAAAAERDADIERERARTDTAGRPMAPRPAATAGDRGGDRFTREPETAPVGDREPMASDREAPPTTRADEPRPATAATPPAPPPSERARREQPRSGGLLSRFKR